MSNHLYSSATLTWVHDIGKRRFVYAFSTMYMLMSWLISSSLIQLVHRIKSRLAQPDCCCGYTLDQAATLEGHVRQWQSALPSQLRQSPVEEGHGQPPNITSVDKVLLAQTCELAVIANLLVIRVYAPFLRKPTPASHIEQEIGRAHV